MTVRAVRSGRWFAWAVLIAFFTAFGPAAAAAETEVRGTVAYRLGYGYDAEELVENSLSLDLSVQRRLGFSGKLYVGFEGRIPFTDEEAELNVGEAYADLYVGATDWRIGRQVISWGTADGFNPTNVINPRGTLTPAALTLAGGALDGEPVLALQASYYLASGGSLTAVAVGEFVPAEGADEMLAAAAGRLSAGLGGLPVEVAGPDPVPADGSQVEWAVRAEGLLGNHNVYVSYFRGWDDYPAAWLEWGPDPLDPAGFMPSKIAASYRRVHKFGVATAGTLKDAGVWTELSYTVFDELEELDGAGALSSNAGYAELVAGADYTFANGLMLSGQVIYSGGGSLLSPYKDPFGDVEPQTYFAGIARYSPEPGHDFEGILLANAGDGGVIAAGRYTYDIRQAAKLILGISRVFSGAGSEFHPLKSMANLISAGVELHF